MRYEEYKKMSEEVRITDPNTGGQKGQKLERFDLVPVGALMELARVYGMGAQKYDDHNWRKGYRWSLSFGALMRHVLAFWGGEVFDPETGLHHLAHAAWHCFTMITFFDDRLGTDDRPGVRSSRSSVDPELWEQGLVPTPK